MISVFTVNVAWRSCPAIMILCLADDYDIVLSGSQISLYFSCSAIIMIRFSVWTAKKCNQYICFKMWYFIVFCYKYICYMYTAVHANITFWLCVIFPCQQTCRNEATKYNEFYSARKRHRIGRPADYGWFKGVCDLQESRCWF